MKKIETQKIGLNFDLKFNEVTDLNPSFASARVSIAYPGRNQNKSDISKEVFEKAIKQIHNIPLVGRFIPEKNDFGSHDIRVVKGSSGDYTIENATVPFGVVPESSNIAWELVKEDDGTEREYLFCDVILWKRQFGYECLASQDTWHQSMEIGVNSYVVDNDGYCVIEDMYFEAFCILGNDVEPCFESASVQMKGEKAVSDYRNQFSLMLEELRNFSLDNAVRHKSKKGEFSLDEKVRDAILAEYQFALADLNFKIEEGMTEEAFRAKLDAMKAASKKEHSFSATYRQKRTALENALDPEIRHDADGNIVSEIYYWIEDFDDEYVFVNRNTWTSDDYKSSVGRFAYSYNESDNSATLTGKFEEMIVQWLTLDENEKLQQSRNAFELLQSEFAAYQADHATKESDVEELRRFKADRLCAEHRAKIDLVLAEFEDLSDNEEFSALTGDGKAYEFQDTEVLRKECFAIRGKNAPTKFAKQNKKTWVKVPIGGSDPVQSRYGDLFDRYG